MVAGISKLCSHKSRAMEMWEIIVTVSVIPTIFLVTFQTGFHAGLVWQWVLIYILDVLYFASVLVGFLTGYKKRGVIIHDRWKVILHQLKTSFVPDLLSLLPLEILAVAASNVPYVAAFLRLNRCIRCYRVWNFLSGKEKELGTNTGLLMCLRYTYLAGVIIHVMACIWFALSCDNSTVDSGKCRANTWTEHTDVDWSSASEFEKYVVTLYWTVTTITSVGYGDILPTTAQEKWVSTIFMLLGIILFGYILGGLASMLTNADAQRARYIHRLNAIRDHLNEAGIGDELKKKVTGYYEYLWQRNRGKGVTELFDELPLAFQAELSLETYRTMIEKSSMFRGAPEEFMRMLSLVVKHMLYLPAQVIIKHGDIGHYMYFITKGEVEVLSDESSSPVAVLKEGDMFGEINLVYSIPSTGTVRAKTHCDILQLSRSDTTQILQHFPEIAKGMKEEIQRRCGAALTEASHLEEYSSVSTLETDWTGREAGTKKKNQWLAVSHRPNGVQRLFKFLKRWWNSHPVVPGSRFAIFWDLLVVVVTTIICWLYSYQAGFSHFKPSVGYAGSTLGSMAFVFSYVLDLVLLADVFVSMKKAIVTPTGVIIDSKTVFLNYVCSPHFLLDLLSVLPFEIFALAWGVTGEQWDYLALFRINRLFKVWKVMGFFEHLEGSLYISIAHVRMLKFTFYILTATHIGACLWFPIACFAEGSCLEDSWAGQHLSANTTGFHDYVISIYWASATMTSVGYGDISATNIQEMVLALVIQLVGVMLYGYCLGAIAATLANAASPRVSFQEKMQVVHQFMYDHKLGAGLLERVDHYFILLWRQFRGEAIPGGQDLMHDMPRSVREDVSMEECSNLLNNVPFVKNADSSFLRQISLTTSTYLFAPGDIVLYSGDMGREMYCIRKGYIEVLSENLSQVVSVLGPGGYFGELGFLFGTPRTATLRAATHCELVMLNRSQLDGVLELYPLIARQFDEMCADKDHLRVALEASSEASCKAMNNPRQFSHPCILTALAVAMATPLSIIVRAPLTNTIAACVGGKDAQSKLACPISLGETVRGSVVKYDRREIEEMMKSDQEWPGHTARTAGLRRRRRQKVAPVDVTPSQLDNREEGRSPPSPPLWWRIVTFMEKILSYCLVPYTFIPTRRAGQIWEIVSTVLAFTTTLTVTMQAAFLHDQPWLWVVNYAMDLFFIADMMLKLHTAYYNKDGVLITLPLACAKRYFKTNFLLDMLASFPTDIIVLASWTRDIEDVLRILSLARLNRSLRVYKLPLTFQYLEDQIARSTGLIMEIKFAVYMVIGTHWTACGWFLLACTSLSIDATDPHTCNVDSWAHKTSDITPLSKFSIAYQYVVSIYWAIATTTTVGYGDIHAHTDFERMFASFVMVVGVVAYGYIIASVAASLANADSTRAQYQEKLKAVKSYMEDQSMDSSIKNRVSNYYEYIWQRNQGVSFASLFQGMPISLQADISLSLYKKIIDQVPLFQNTEIGFTKLLALSINPVLFLSKEYIVRKGDIGSEMFFINRGTVEVVSEDGSVVFATMNEGKFFGEISLIFSCPRTASIRALTNCDLFVLTKRDLDRALTYYPHIAEQIRMVAGNRANLVKKRSEIAAKAAAEGKSAKDAAQAAAQGTKDEAEEETKPAEKKPSSRSVGQETTVMAVESDEESEAEEGPPLLVVCWERLQERVWPVVKKALTFTISSVGRFGTMMHLLGCLLAYFSAFTISYQATFQNNSSILWFINYLFEMYFLVEIFIKFHLTYEDARGQMVTNFKSIALHYLKDRSGFPLDLAAIFPYELLALPISDPGIRMAAVLYLRLPHVARVVRIHGFFSVEEKRLNQKTVLIRLLKFIVLISLCTHFVACAWYVFGCQAGECQSNTWARTAQLVNTTVTDADHYCNSLYWAVTTMTTTGYGDLSATNVQEMLYAVIVMVFGKLLFGFILGSIASTLANLDTQRVLFEEKLSALKYEKRGDKPGNKATAYTGGEVYRAIYVSVTDYMREQHLPLDLQHRVLDFFDYLWVRNKGTDRQNLLSDMPYCMQAEVSLATTETLLRKVPIFAAVDAAFLRHLTLMIKPCLFLPGEFIVHKGDMGLGMFFLYHGTVEVADIDGPVTDILTEGSYFGQKSLVYNTPMESSYRAVTHVDMFMLSQSDFEKVLQDHPPTKTMISQVVEEEYGVPMHSSH